MATFKNANQAKPGSYTRVLFCVAETAPADGVEWVECDPLELDLSGCEKLYTQAGAQYFGNL